MIKLFLYFFKKEIKMKKLVVLSIFVLIVSSFLIAQEPVKVGEKALNLKAGVFKVDLSSKDEKPYSKLIVETSPEEMIFTTIKIFFKDKSEIELKQLTASPSKKLEAAIDSKTAVKKMTFYFRNAKDEKKPTIVKVYLEK
jgi:hypothetical protein